VKGRRSACLTKSCWAGNWLQGIFFLSLLLAETAWVLAPVWFLQFWGWGGGGRLFSPLWALFLVGLAWFSRWSLRGGRPGTAKKGAGRPPAGEKGGGADPDKGEKRRPGGIDTGRGNHAGIYPDKGIQRPGEADPDQGNRRRSGADPDQGNWRRSGADPDQGQRRPYAGLILGLGVVLAAAASLTGNFGWSWSSISRGLATWYQSEDELAAGFDIFFIALVFWWRGLVRGGQYPGQAQAAEVLTWGLPTLFLVAGGTALLGQLKKELALFLWPLLVTYFFSIGLALVTGRLLDIRGRNQTEGMPAARRWVLFTTGLLLLLLLTGTAVALLIAPTFGNGLAHLWDVIVKGLEFALYPVGFLAQFLVYLARWLRTLLGLGQNQLPEKAPELTPDLPDYFTGPTRYLPPWGRVLAMILVVAGLVLLMLRTWRRLVQESREEEDEKRESVFSWSELAGSARRWWRARGKAHPVSDPLAGDPTSGAALRRLYRWALRQAAQRGHPRRPAETPWEFLPDLTKAFEAQKDAAQALTDYYVRLRYGGRAPTSEEVEKLRRAIQSKE